MFGLFTIREIILVATCIMAAATNPDDESLREYLQDQGKRRGQGWLERSVSAVVKVTVDRPRRDFGLFSTVYYPEEDIVLLGAFGNWYQADIRMLRNFGLIPRR